MAQKQNYGKKNAITNINNTIQIEGGRIPPQAIEMEEAVLGAVMLEKDAIIEVLDILKPECFYVEAHQKIYTAIVNLSSAQKPVDMLTVTNELNRMKELDSVGGAFYITQLTTRIASAANIEFHARIVAQKYIQREMIRVSSEIQKKAFDEETDVDQLIDFAEGTLFAVSEGNIRKKTMSIQVLVKEAIKQIEAAGKREDHLSGVPSGFSELDRITSGWQFSDLVIIAARPSMGKTAFVLSMARNMAVEHKRPLAFFSLEMSSIQLVNRLIVGETEIKADLIRNGRLTNADWENLTNKITKLSDAQIFIDDTPSLSVFEFRAKARRLKAAHDIQCIIIDYLQLMTAGGDAKGNRQEEVSLISRSLKAIAKELNVPIIALSQLNRGVETRTGDKRPHLSDLRESGAIEQDADIVVFIHRPEYYGITVDENNNSLINVAQLIIAKHRNGALEDVNLKFEKEFIKFVEPTELIQSLGGGDSSPYTSVIKGSKMNTAPAFESTDPYGGNAISSNTSFDNDQTPF